MVVIAASSEVCGPLRIDITKFGNIEVGIVIAHLWSRKSATSVFELTDSFRSALAAPIEFPHSEIRLLGLRAVVSMEFFSPTGHYLGLAIVPVFSARGLLQSGPLLVELDTAPLEDPAVAEPMLCRHWTGSDLREVKGRLERYFAGKNSWAKSPPLSYETDLQPIEWALPREPIVPTVPFILLSFPTVYPTIFSDSFKSSFHRSASAHLSPASAPRPRSLSQVEPLGLFEKAPVLCNWMVVNGPVSESRGASKTISVVPGCGFVGSVSFPSSPIQVIDYELFKDHPSATKAGKLHRETTQLKVPVAKSAVRPSADDVSRLNDIVLQPVRTLTQTERELLVRFLWSLVDKKHALLKVLIALVTSEELDDGATDQLPIVVAEVLRAWTPVDIDGALALLGEEIGESRVATQVREYAISRLSAIASDEQLQLFLFQLVQSLRYETSDVVSVFLIDRAVKDEALASALFWYLQCEEGRVVSEQLWRELGRSEGGRKIRDGIERQCEFRLRLLDMARITAKGAVENRNEMLREAIRGNLIGTAGSAPIQKVNLTNRLTFPLPGAASVDIPIPADPIYSLVRVDEKNSFCVKSNKAPFVLACEVFNRETRQTELKRYMFKIGDDLRQDVLVIQLIRLIDGILKSYGLDLKLSPYRVLATSAEDGFVEFVADSQTLSSILASNNNDLMAYFRTLRPALDAAFGVDPAVIDTFSRSCAGYCALTYILGIGDRHMDNLLITSEGKLFHVDFGYILGRDPKPFPPPMKLCREMVEGMGGAASPHYRSFVSRCTQAFLIMRRHANLIVSLLYLAANANIKDMREQDPKLAILKVQKRLMVEVSDEVAEQHMVALINESTSALFPVVIERLHKWAQYWRT